MSRSRRKRKKIKPREVAPKAPSSSAWTTREKLSVGGAITVSLLVFIGSGPLMNFFKDRNELVRRLAKWKEQYHLNDAQLDQLHKVEVGFHGNGNPFTAPGHPSHEESEIHHHEVDSILRQGSEKARPEDEEDPDQ